MCVKTYNQVFTFHACSIVLFVKYLFIEIFLYLTVTHYPEL